MDNKDIHVYRRWFFYNGERHECIDELNEYSRNFGMAALMDEAFGDAGLSARPLSVQWNFLPGGNGFIEMHLPEKASEAVLGRAEEFVRCHMEDGPGSDRDNFSNSLRTQEGLLHTRHVQHVLSGGMARFSYQGTLDEMQSVRSYDRPFTYGGTPVKGPDALTKFAASLSMAGKLNEMFVQGRVYPCAQRVDFIFGKNGKGNIHMELSGPPLKGGNDIHIADRFVDSQTDQDGRHDTESLADRLWDLPSLLDMDNAWHTVKSTAESFEPSDDTRRMPYKHSSVPVGNRIYERKFALNGTVPDTAAAESFLNSLDFKDKMQGLSIERMEWSLLPQGGSVFLEISGPKSGLERSAANACFKDMQDDAAKKLSAEGLVDVERGCSLFQKKNMGGFLKVAGKDVQWPTERQDFSDAVGLLTEETRQAGKGDMAL